MRCFSADQSIFFVFLAVVLAMSSATHPCFGAEKSHDDIDYNMLSHYALEPGKNINYADSIIDRNNIIDIGTSKQLFIDEMFIKSSHGIKLTMNPPYQTGEVLITNDQPWEKGEKARKPGCQQE